MVCRKITYYKMLTPERRAEIAAAVGATDLRSQARFAAGQSPSSLEPSYEEEEADPMFMAEVAAQKAPDGYETMDVDFVPASESPMVQADQRFNLAILGGLGGRGSTRRGPRACRYHRGSPAGGTGCRGCEPGGGGST